MIPRLRTWRTITTVELPMRIRKPLIAIIHVMLSFILRNKVLLDSYKSIVAIAILNF